MPNTRLEGFSKMLCDYAPGKAKWSPEEMPDLTGKIIIVTGGNTGIGYETAQALLLRNATVYIGARSVAKGEAAVKSLSEATGNTKVWLLKMDLADLPTVKKAVEEFQSKEQKLHVLINNAGVMNVPKDLLTAQNYDLQFGTNVIGHYFLSRLLIPMMERTGATLPPTDPARLIELTSDGHLINANTGIGLINYDTILPGNARDRTGTMQLYCQSKSANLLVSMARARLFAGKNIVSMSVHPDRSHKVGTGSPYFCYRNGCGGNDAISYTNGCDHPAYLGPWARVREPRSDHVNNVEAEDKLITWLDEQLRVNEVL